tara:strand:+ start:1394 stop:1813 length:420 start_codon:yes stop_codon:yes gene_type:complete
VKKKYIAPSKDKKDWDVFTKQIGNINPKEEDFNDFNYKPNKFRKLDLHGYSLVQANKMVNQFINESFNNGYKKLLIVTGKGLRSKNIENPYISEKFSVLKHSVPEYIKSDENLFKKVKKISKASLNDGGEGAIYVFLNN